LTAMTIARLAKAGGVGVETVRYYQRRGLMVEPERVGGSGANGAIRRYSESDVQRLRFIRSAQTAGFTLAQIGELLALDATEDRSRARQMARERIAFIDQKITELASARNALERLADRCSGTTSGPCPILTSFETPAHNGLI
jgi:MerR family transcriptional regulator, mercuric resistance operon regulatory protein